MRVEGVGQNLLVIARDVMRKQVHRVQVGPPERAFGALSDGWPLWPQGIGQPPGHKKPSNVSKWLSAALPREAGPVSPAQENLRGRGIRRPPVPRSSNYGN